MFSPTEREAVRQGVLALARSDGRVSGGALTGSAAAGAEDGWSDVDVAFGVAEGAEPGEVLDDWTDRLAADLDVVHHFDLRAGAATYRVFLLASGLELDVGVLPAAGFGAAGRAFRLVFGESRSLPAPAGADVDHLVGLGWHHALHSRAAIERRRPWLACYWIGALRDHSLALACVRHGLPAVFARGVDDLPGELLDRWEASLVGSLEPAELRRARAVAVGGFLAEVRIARPELVGRLALALDEPAAGDPPAPAPA